ncbi:MAG: hypothetical protein ABSF23_04215 [Terracidiphilus sp.]
MTVIEELQGAIQKLHGVKATHRESVPVKETWKGKTIWDGVVEVFDLHGHPQTDTAYAWFHDTGDATNPLAVTVLHIDPALSPAKAVRAFIVQEYDNAEEA